MSESLTFVAGYICTAFGCPEIGGDEPFSAKRPLSTEGDAEIEHGGVSACGSFVVVHFRSSTLHGTPTEMTASLDSSHHVFFFSTS